MAKQKIGVILSGCGNRDGSEIHEATLTLWAIHKQGADFQCFAPDMDQHHVLNHFNGEEMAETRNVLVESARIARGNIRDIKEFRTADFDAVIFPGGAGAAKNLSTYAFEGPNCTVNDDVARIIREMHAAAKPIGALCIAPVILARVLDGITLTVGRDAATEKDLAAMGAGSSPTGPGEIAVDRANKIVSTPCYMLESRIDQIGEGAENLVKAILEMTA